MEIHVSESNTTVVHFDQKDGNLNSFLQYHPKMDEFQGFIMNDTQLIALLSARFHIFYEKQLCAIGTQNFTDVPLNGRKLFYFQSAHQYSALKLTANS